MHNCSSLDSNHENVSIASNQITHFVDVLVGVPIAQKLFHHRFIYYSLFIPVKIYCSDHKSLFRRPTLIIGVSSVSLDYVFPKRKQKHEPFTS